VRSGNDGTFEGAGETGLKIHDSQPHQVVGLDVASKDQVEADELHNNEAPTAALNLGAVFDREAAHGCSSPRIAEHPTDA
jgi:hypothetical protein